MALGLVVVATPLMAQKLQPAAGSLVAHDVNRTFLRVSNRGGFGLSLEAPDVGNFPRGSPNRYLFGSGLWIGGIGDVDADGQPDSVTSIGYNPSEVQEIEWIEGALDFSRDDPRFRVLDSTEPGDQDLFPGDPVAAQELFAIYGDRFSVVTGMRISIPLGIEVRQRSFAFDEPGLDSAVIFQWDLLNISDRIRTTGYTIGEMWTGLVLDPDLGVTTDDTAAPLEIDGQPILLIWDADFQEAAFSGPPGFLAIVPLAGIGERVNVTQMTSGNQPGVLRVPRTDAGQYAALAGLPSAPPTIVQPGFDLRALVAWGGSDVPQGAVHRTAAAFVWADPAGAPPAALSPLDPTLDQDLPVLAGLVAAVRTVRSAYDERLAGLPSLLSFPGTPPPPPAGGGSGALEQNFPNPFRDRTTIRYEVTEAGPVEIVIYDLQGREVERLVEGNREPGDFVVEWDGLSSSDGEVPAGVYVVRMSTAAGTSSIRVLKAP